MTGMLRRSAWRRAVPARRGASRAWASGATRARQC